MMERPARGYFGGLWVFPGGGVEKIDGSALARSAVNLPAETEDVVWRVAALRETTEEVGVAVVESDASTSALVPMVASGQEVFGQIKSSGHRFDGAGLRLLSQWVTPRQAPTRFDARFYVTVVDDDPRLVLQKGEVMAAEWVTPTRALDRYDDGNWKMVTPTLHHLRWLSRFERVDDMWAAAADASGARVEPIVETDGSEVRVRLPAWAELP